MLALLLVLALDFFLARAGGGEDGFPVDPIPRVAAAFDVEGLMTFGVTGRDLLLGTEGGLLRARRDDSGATDLLVRPFLAAGAVPDPLVWLCTDGTRLAVRGGSGARWEVKLADFQRITSAAGPPVSDQVATDDLLRWQHPAPGTVTVSFQPQRTMPADLPPPETLLAISASNQKVMLRTIATRLHLTDGPTAKLVLVRADHVIE